MDLADAAEGHDLAREIGPPHRDTNAIAALGQRPHYMAADEPRAAEDGDETTGRQALLGHGVLPWLSSGGRRSAPHVQLP